MELARRGDGITVNTIRAGVTKTPALMKIPEHEMIIEAATRRNPTGRMTTPQDVANAIVALSGEGTDFINGETIGVDGGEVRSEEHMSELQSRQYLVFRL